MKLKKVMFLGMISAFLFILTGCSFDQITNQNVIDYSDKLKRIKQLKISDSALKKLKEEIYIC